MHGRSLTPTELELLETARRAVLATTRGDGTARLVPITFAARQDGRSVTVYSPLDDKPKSVGDPRDLARVRDIRKRPRVSLLVDRWSEDWLALGWVRLDGHATILEPSDPPTTEHVGAVDLLRQRYAQYATRALERALLIRVAVDGVASWTATGEGAR